jgi:HEAT repeat protein
MMRDGAHAPPSLISFSLVIGFALQLGCLQEAPAPSVERSIAVLMALLRDETPELRRTAAESLGKIGDRSAASALLPLLTDPTPSVRAAAAQALGRMADSRDDAVITALIQRLEDSSDRVKQVAALAIGEIEASASQLGPVADLLRAPDVEVRRAAVRALLLVETRPFTEALLPLLNDQDVEVRQGAVAALSLSGDQRAAAAVARRLAEDPSPAVRTEAAYHLGHLSGPAIRARLHAVLGKESDAGVRRWIEADVRGLRVND